MDEMQIHRSPVLLGWGVRLFDSRLCHRQGARFGQAVRLPDPACPLRSRFASNRAAGDLSVSCAPVPPQTPDKIEPKSPDDYLEVMTKAVFQSGMSWRVIEAKWDGFREAFEGFDVEKVAGFGPDDVERLAEDTRIVRNRRKIQATVDNADEILALDRQHDGFRNYLRSHPSFEETVADLKRRFSFLGDTGSYYFLHVVGEKVPSHEAWLASRP
jgi:3-methyladenine DNA glycosylase Tag